MVDLTGIKNIIFDYGGVIINIDFKLSVDTFKLLGFYNVEEVLFRPNTSKLLVQMEKGLINPTRFYDEIRRISNRPLTNEEIDNAWNALLLDMPEKRIRLLEKLKREYRIFLLSNTNVIHYHKCLFQLKNNFEYTSFDSLFEKAWFSFDLSMVKPDSEIFNYVLSDASLNPTETLFIDDSEINIKGAINAKMKTYYLANNKEITEVF